MLNDYQPEISENERLKRGHRRKGRILLVGAIVGAAAVYSTMQLMVEAPAPIPVAETPSLPGPVSSEPLQKPSHKIDLALPTRTETIQDTGPADKAVPKTTLPLPVLSAKEPESGVDPDTTRAMPAESSLVQLPVPAEPALAEPALAEPALAKLALAELALAELALSELALETAADAPEAPLSLTNFVAVADIEIVKAAEPPVPASDQDQQFQPSLPGTWVEDKVKSGDSLARIFSRNNLSANLLHRIVHSGKEAKKLALIKPGETLKFRLDDDGNLLELVYQKNPIRSVQILPDGESFTLNKIERKLERRVTRSSGTITDSLYQSAQREGLSDNLIMELANIFGWDVDFALEIRAGDRFSLIYEEKYLDGEKYGNGPILAAEFVNKSRVFRAIRYEDEKGYGSYFSPDGGSMQKVFLRAPVDFRRISSRFTRSRWHPVLGKKRSHRGVDYAAATGTPIKASGEGRVTYRGRKGGYGKAVIIQHGQKITTLYGHMSKFKGSVKKGTRVRQGQVIGYVGKTGLATGPHLHYEFRVNGVHRNPLTVKLPPSSPIDKKYREDFQTKSAPLLAELDQMSRTMVATAE